MKVPPTIPGHILPVPFVQQPNWYYCGATCVSMVLTYFGIEHDLMEVAKRAGTNEVVGATHDGLARAAESYGVVTAQNYNASYADLVLSIDQDEPVILYTHWPEAPQYEHGELDQMHYILVVGYADGHLIVHDPDFEDGEPDVAFPDQELFDRWRSEQSPDDFWMMSCRRPQAAQPGATTTAAE
jgi:ABC-type bacteriocin/lantibiotic exporter with double-glycine peptidase domain